MKQTLLAVILVFVSLYSFADGMGHRQSPVTAEIQAILDQESDTVISELTFGQIQDLLGRLSIPLQQAAFVKKSALASHMIPGVGQFLNGDTGTGLLFLGADLVVAAATVVGTYLLLPASLQFGELDYFNTPMSEIKAAWTTEMEGMTFVRALPTLGVMTGGMVLHMVISGLSSHHAARLARERIESGKVVFEPRLGLLADDGHLAMALGLGLRL